MFMNYDDNLAYKCSYFLVTLYLDRIKNKIAVNID